MSTPPHPDYLATAQKHLERIQAAWYEPTDWDDLTLYGFYCLEAAVMAVGARLGREIRSTHPAKVEAAVRFAADHGLPAIYYLLISLNRARKAVAYGDTPLPKLDAAHVAQAIEEYVAAAAKFIGERNAT